MKLIRFNDRYENLQKIDEGTWGYKPLDSDSASDWKWKFGNLIYEELATSLEGWIGGDDLLKIYEGIGMWEYFRDKHVGESYGIFSKEQIQDLDFLTTKSSEYLLEKYTEMGWKEPEKVKQYLEKFIEKINK